MTTHNKRLGSTGNAVGGAWNAPWFVLENTVDFADGTTYEAADTVQLFNIPAGTWVLLTTIHVVTGEGATCTVDLGDADSTDGFIDGGDIETAGVFLGNKLALTEGTPNTLTDTYLFPGGRLCAAAEVISLVLGHDTDAAKITVRVFGISARAGGGN
jgi:hypothetical protein